MAIRKRPFFAIFISFKPCVFGFRTNIANRSSSRQLSIPSFSRNSDLISLVILAVLPGYSHNAYKYTTSLHNPSIHSLVPYTVHVQYYTSNPSSIAPYSYKHSTQQAQAEENGTARWRSQ